MNKKRYFAVAAAALLAVAPIATTSFVSSPMIVKADSVASMDQINNTFYQDARKEYSDSDYSFIKLTKKTPYIVGYNNQTVKSFADQRVTDVTSNIGRVNKLVKIYVFPAMDNGMPDFGNVLHQSDKLKFGKNYVALLSCNVSFSNDDGKVIMPIGTNNYHTNEAPQADWNYINSNDIGLFVPIKVSNKKIPSSTTKVNARGYVTARKGHKVRTYTSTGKFSKHYVYGHKTYKLNQKKIIKGHGTCYKIYGKNQWIPSKYLKF
ncbi:hypothetical protein [Lactobacillus sp. PSON]|uniref:hypothetical protein n=1 Tax=Lactobacillus sp. PSON TaxID=3455454 RepID=UPI0040436568